jgi:hypothetical protein
MQQEKRVFCVLRVAQHQETGFFFAVSADKLKARSFEEIAS